MGCLGDITDSSYMPLLLSHSVVSDSLPPRGRQPTRLLCPWDSPGKKTGVAAMPSSRGSSRPGDRTPVSYVSCICKWGLYHYYHQYNIVNQIYVNINTHTHTHTHTNKEPLKKRPCILSQSGEHCDLRPETVTAPEPARLLGGQS